ncbi:MAG: hypothetical protein AABY52_03795 [Deltaproteobacteria bacterium]
MTNFVLLAIIAITIRDGFSIGCGITTAAPVSSVVMTTFYKKEVLPQ